MVCYCLELNCITKKKITILNVKNVKPYLQHKQFVAVKTKSMVYISFSKANSYTFSQIPRKPIIL